MLLCTQLFVSWWTVSMLSLLFYHNLLLWSFLSSKCYISFPSIICLYSSAIRLTITRSSIIIIFFSVSSLPTVIVYRLIPNPIESDNHLVILLLAITVPSLLPSSTHLTTHSAPRRLISATLLWYASSRTYCLHNNGVVVMPWMGYSRELSFICIIVPTPFPPHEPHPAQTNGSSGNTLFRNNIGVR